jgi:hypothetical protein
MIKKILLRSLALLGIVGVLSCHAPANRGLNLYGFQQISLGMSKAEVDEIAHSRGTPKGKDLMNAEAYKYYGSDDSSHWASISFKNGKVSSKRQYGIQSDQGIPKELNLNLEIFDQISEGMSKFDVDRIIQTTGIVTLSVVDSSVDRESYNYSSRKDNASWILITTDNDKVIAKSQHGLQSKHAIYNQASLSAESLNHIVIGMTKSEVDGLAHSKGILKDSFVSYTIHFNYESYDYYINNDTSRWVMLRFNRDTLIDKHIFNP